MRTASLSQKSASGTLLVRILRPLLAVVPQQPPSSLNQSRKLQLWWCLSRVGGAPLIISSISRKLYTQRSHTLPSNFIRYVRLDINIHLENSVVYVCVCYLKPKSRHEARVRRKKKAKKPPRARKLFVGARERRCWSDIYTLWHLRPGFQSRARDSISLIYGPRET